MEGILKELVFALGFEIRKASPYYQFLLYFSNVFLGLFLRPPCLGMS